MKRVRHIYEVLDALGGTIGFAPTIPAAESMVKQAEPGARWQVIAVPMQLVLFCQFLTEKAGGAS